MDFEIVGQLGELETIARGRGIREIERLRKTYGARVWLKRKGVARVKLQNDTIWMAELHWHEAHGVGKKEVRLKRRWRESE